VVCYVLRIGEWLRVAEPGVADGSFHRVTIVNSGMLEGSIG
jgi:hypothetical protein